MTDANNSDGAESNDVVKLKRALQAERAEHKTTADKLKEATSKLAERGTLADPSAATITQHIAESVKAGVARETASMQQRIASLESELTDSRKSGEALLGQLSQRTIADEVREAARAAHVREEALADVLTMGGLELKLLDGYVQTADGRDVSEWLEGRKGTSPYWWPASCGAGARGSFGDGGKVYTGENPFAPGPGFNLTRQGELLRADPEAAKLLQAQVGE